jgi:hypothetical protein
MDFQFLPDEIEHLGGVSTRLKDFTEEHHGIQ